MRKSVKYSLIAVGVLLLLLIAVPLMIPTSAYLGPLQEQASKALGAKVVIGDLRLAMAPLPHATATNIDIGDGAIKLEKMAIYPTLSTLFSSVREIRTIDAENLTVTPKGVEMLAALAGGAEDAPAAAGKGAAGKGADKGAADKGKAGGKDSKDEKDKGAATPPAGGSSAPPVSIGKLKLKNANVELASGKLPPIDVDVELKGGTAVENALVSIDGGKAKLKVDPEGEGWNIDFSASDWVLPMGSPLKFDSLKAKGRATKEGLSLPDITAKLYSGTVKAKADLNWVKVWRLAGNAEINDLDIAPALKAMKLNASLSGRLDAKGPFSAQAPKPAGLTDALNADFAFNVKNGVLHGFDLATAASSIFKSGSKGGQTKFDQLSGNAVIVGHGYRMRNVQVVSGALAARGNVDISPAKQLAGRVDVDLKTGIAKVGVPLTVSGTVSDPVLMPSASAIAGAVAGTVLAPGVGTAAGASVGDKIGKFFGKK